MRAAGGSLAALHDALQVGWGANLAGGTHHAFRERAAGFCLVNDAAILTRIALDKGLARRVATLDLDVHQGNGTASILMPLPGGSGVALPAVRSAHPDGTLYPAFLTPDVPVSPDWRGMADGQPDPMLQKAFEVLQKP